MTVRIPIKKFVDDETLPLEARFETLLRHHKEETTWLIAEVERLEEERDEWKLCWEQGHVKK